MMQFFQVDADNDNDPVPRTKKPVVAPPRPGARRAAGGARVGRG